LIWVAVIAVFVVGLVGLAIDTGQVVLAAHRLQNAADAAALAAAQLVKTDPDQARAAAVQVGAANQAANAPVLLDANVANVADGDIVIGRFDRTTGTFTVTTTAPNAARVTARRTSERPAGGVAILFGRIFGIASVDVARSATAMMGGGTGAGLITLDEDDPEALEISGDVTLDVDGGAIQVNSENSQALRVDGHPTIYAPDINVCGNVRFSGGGAFEGNMNVGADPIPDPLGFLPDLTAAGMADRGSVSVQGGTVSVEPGYYSGGIAATGGDVVLAPGVYVLDGAGLAIGGNTNFTAEGVLFYIVGAGVVDLTGIGNIRVTPPDPGEHGFPEAATYEGVTIFQDRSNANAARIVGASSMHLSGTLYFPAARLKLSGTGDGFGTQLIANTVDVSGVGEIHINYDGRFPAPGTRVFLVE